jgi:micrococcal nuclease
LLRYAFTAQGENVGTLLLEQGYVKEFTFIKDYNFKNNYLAAQKRAQEKEVGIWAPDICQ